MDHIGIDVHKNASQVCIRTETGRLVERRVRTDRQSIAKWLGRRDKARILIESSTESEWVARCLEELGHEVIVADPNFAPMYAQRSRKVKTDRRDARALCEACELGAYRPAHRSSDRSRALRAQVAVREALVHTRTRDISLIRALLRQQGYRVRSGSARRSNLQLAITPPTLAPRQVRRGQTILMGMRGRRISGRKHQVQQSHHPSGVRKLGETLEGSDCTGTPETSFHCTLREEVSHLHRFRGQSRSDEIVRGLSYAMDERGVHPRARRLSTTCTSFH